jgi:hypothetical protein
MGIAKDATPEEITAKVRAWFKSFYDMVATIGEIDSVKADERDKDYVFALPDGPRPLKRVLSGGYRFTICPSSSSPSNQ